MTDNKRFNIYDEYNADMKFYKLPKVFFTNPLYSNLSFKSKIAWALLRDRLELSKKNKWIDENGDIYFRYSNQKLATILNCSKRSVTDIRSELKKVNLLSTKSRGLTLDDVLYLQYPIVTKEDIYKIDNDETIDPFQDESTLKTKQAADLAKKRHEKEAAAKKLTYPGLSKQSVLNPSDSAETQKNVTQQKSYNTNVSAETQKNVVLEAQNLRTSDTEASELSIDTKEALETSTDLVSSLSESTYKVLAEERETLTNVFYRNHQDSYFDKISLVKILVLTGYNTTDAERVLKASNNAKRKIEKTMGDKLYLAHMHAITALDETVSEVAKNLLNDAVEQIIYQVKKGTVKDKFAYAYTVFLSSFIEIAMFKLIMELKFDGKTKTLFKAQLNELEQLATNQKFDVSKLQERSTRLAEQYDRVQASGEQK